MFKYAYIHTPTQKWVKINHHLICPEVELYGYTTSIELTEKQEWATVHSNKQIIKEDLISASFLNNENYCRDNFLEFKIIKL